MVEHGLDMFFFLKLPSQSEKKKGFSMPGDQRHADLGAGQSEPCGQDGWEVYFGEFVSARFIGGDWAKNH